MSKKLSWLDKFAEEQAGKMEKTASLAKKAEQIIVDPDEVPGAETGASLTYKGASYKVVDANYNDDVGAGVVLEKSAALEDEKVEDTVPAEKCEVCGNEPCTCEAAPTEVAPEAPMAAPAPVGGKKLTDAPEMARTNPGDVYNIEVRDTVEQQKFEGEAAETASNIAAENAIDGTTVPGKFNRILQRMQAAPIAPVETPAEAPVALETPVEEVKEEAPVEEKAEEVPAEEVKEEIPAEGEEVVDEEKKEKMANNRIFSRMISAIKK